MKHRSESAAKFVQSWASSPGLTPRQARAISITLDVWGDETTEWLTAGVPREPLHTRTPFSYFDLRVMMLVDDNLAWAAAAAERCYAVADEITLGVLPFDRPGCYFDELLMGAALLEAQDLVEMLPDLFAGIPARTTGGEDYWVTDDDWDAVSDGFDDRCRWDEWEVPIYRNHPLLPVILAERHPFRWFDLSPATGPGYMQKLSGMVVDETVEE